MKKAFTLVELLAVIILLGLLGLIIYPTVNGVINNNKNKLHDKQIDELIRHGNTYSTTNMGKLNTTDGSRNIVTFNDLYESGLIQNSKVIDPKTDLELTGCLSLIFNKSRNNFDIEYTENCNNSFNLSGKINQIDPLGRTDTKFISTDFKVQLLQDNQIIYETNTDSDGNYSFTNIEGGKYLILISQPYKTKYGREIVLVNNEVKNFKDIKLYAGDFNEDGIILMDDVKNLQDPKCFVSNTIDKPDCAIYDLNKDGVINYEDFNLAIGSNTLTKTDNIMYNGNSNININLTYSGNIVPNVVVSNNDQTFEASINDKVFSFNNLSNGVYALKINKNGHTSHYQRINVKENYNTNIIIYAGDHNDDGIIDKIDVNAIQSVIIDIANGDSTYDYEKDYFDLNEDGVIDNKDVDIVKANIGKKAIEIK